MSIFDLEDKITIENLRKIGFVPSGYFDGYAYMTHILLAAHPTYTHHIYPFSSNEKELINKLNLSLLENKIMKNKGRISIKIKNVLTENNNKNKSTVMGGGLMEKKENSKFPEGFFIQPRPRISMKEAIKDVVPFKWSKNVLHGNSKVKIVSAKDNG